MSEPLLVLEDVVRRFEVGGVTQTVLDGLSWSLERGAAAAVVGESGSGKSTLLHLIGALDRPSAGTIRLDGRDLAGLDDEALARLRAGTIGFVFQDHHLLPQCTALENVLVPTLATRRAAGAEAEARARALLERVGLGAHAGKRPAQLSGGERQRVAVVRALIERPALLLADEPTGSLDRAASANLVELLLELHRADGVALVVVTHDATVAARVGAAAAPGGGESEGGGEGETSGGVFRLEDGRLRPEAPVAADRQRGGSAACSDPG